MDFIVYSNLRFARENFGYTVRELASKVNIHFGGLSKNENGKRGLPIEHVEPLANALDCSFEFIMQKSDFGLFAYYLDKKVLLSIEQYQSLNTKGLIGIYDYKRYISNEANLDNLKPLVYGL